MRSFCAIEAFPTWRLSFLVKVSLVQAAMRELAGFFKDLARTAEQLGMKERIQLIVKRAFRKLLASAPPLSPKKNGSQHRGEITQLPFLG